MSVSASDLTVVLSGGSLNLDPNSSLGGDPSSAPITDDVLNNLFGDVSSDQATNGYVDYRCLYLFNDGTDTLYNVAIWITSDPPDGSSMQMGIAQQNESQRITLSGGTTTGGSFTLNYRGQTFVSNFNADLGAWALALQEGLLALQDSNHNPFFKSLTVTAAQAGASTIIFDIAWNGLDAKRSFDQFQISHNAIQPLGIINVNIATTILGTPVNTISAQLEAATTPPGGVTFFVPTAASPLLVPRLEPAEGFPFWIMRTTAANTPAKANDGFSIRVSAESLEP